MPGLQSQAPANAAPAPTFSPANERLLYDDNSSQVSSASTTSGFRPDLVIKMKFEYRALDIRRVPRIKSL